MRTPQSKVLYSLCPPLVNGRRADRKAKPRHIAVPRLCCALMLLAAFPLFATLSAHAPCDSLQQSLGEAQVAVQRRGVARALENGVTELPLRALEGLPMIMGNTDPLRYARSLPAAATASEYDAGLHLQGSDNAQSAVTLCGVPVYNAQHMLGFFSTFIPDHFDRLLLQPSSLDGAAPQRVGGWIDLLPDTVRRRRVQGRLDAGLMSSQVTALCPCGTRGSLTLSARAAYVDWLYGPWLKFEGNTMSYGFHDVNVTYARQLAPTTRLMLFGYAGGDRVGFTESDYLADTHLRWGNAVGGAQLTHRVGGAELSHKLYATGMYSRFSLSQPTMRLTLPADIATAGYAFRLQRHALSAGASAAFHTITPQHPEVVGGYANHAVPAQHLRAVDARLYASQRIPLSRTLSAEVGVRTSLFRTAGQRTYFGFDPSLCLQQQVAPRLALELRAGTLRQNLLQTGFSAVGLPVEFYHPATRAIPPQCAEALALSARATSPRGGYAFSAELYYKRLHHVQNYTESLFELFSTNYNLSRALTPGRGTNYGVNLMVEKRRGRLTGWLSAALGRAQRSAYRGGEYVHFPASHERLYELKTTATYRLTDRWRIGAMLTCASGTPFTAPRSLLIVGDQVVARYGAYNSNRLRPYCRLDLSGTYVVSRRGHREGALNYSLYNATMYHNDIFYRIKFHKDGTFSYAPVRFVLPLLPSLSYILKF